MEIHEIEATAARIRRRVLRHVLDNNGGYLSQACSAAELLATLYGGILRIGPSLAPAIPAPFSGVPSAANPTPTRGGDYNGPRGPEQDRFLFYQWCTDVGLRPAAFQSQDAGDWAARVSAGRELPGSKIDDGQALRIVRYLEEHAR